MKVKLKRWHGVAVWKWEIDEDVCGICRMPFEACCPGVKFPGDDCPPVWGQCGHAFHMQCLMKWLESQQNTRQECPYCRQPWNFRSETTNTSNTAITVTNDRSNNTEMRN